MLIKSPTRKTLQNPRMMILSRQPPRRRPSQGPLLRVLLWHTLLCLVLAAPGLWRNRLPSVETRARLLRDILCVICENHFLLAAWWWWWWWWWCVREAPLMGGTITLNSSHKKKVLANKNNGTLPKQSSHCRSNKSTRPRRRCACVLKTLLLLLLTTTWILASWGDYVFQQQSQGMLPRVEWIASGLADPNIHWHVQLDPAHRRVFWTGLLELLGCLGVVGFLMVGMGVVVGYQQYKQRQKGQLPLPHTGSFPEKERGYSHSHSFDYSEERLCWDFLMTSRLSQALHAWCWIFLYTAYGAWAPLLNLTTAWMLSWAWVLQASAAAVTTTTLPESDTSILAPFVLESTIDTAVRNNSTTNFTTTTTYNDRNNKNKHPNKRPQEKIPPVNVILVVHESLAASAMESRRGQRAAPWFASNIMNQDVKTENKTYAAQHNPNFYYFSSATSPAGGTPTATPAILTGLLTYDTKGMTVMRQSGLAADFQRLGYETASFVSYGATWQHTTWRVLTDLLASDEPQEMDLVLDPATTGEPRVNEYGMDDRRMVQYMDTWLQLRQNSPEFQQWNQMMRNNGRKKLPKKNRHKKQTRSNVTATSTRAEQVIRATKYGYNHTTDGEVGTQPKGSPPPFFAQVIFNNQHFPHLMHEHYTGLDTRDCADDYSDDYFSMFGYDNEDMDHDYGNGSITADGLLQTDNSTDDDEFEAQRRQHQAKHPSAGDGSSEHSYREPCWDDSQHQPIPRYFSSLRTMDESLQALFDALKRTGELDNTIVMGAGDHGETPGLTKRLENMDATIMRVPLWMHIPERLLANRYTVNTDDSSERGKGDNPKSRAKKVPAKTNATTPAIPNGTQTPVLVADVLRSNAHQSVSTLDIVPTLRDILNFPRLYTKQQEATCITGLTLAKERLSDERLAVGWGGSPLAGVFIAAFATKTQALLVCPKEMDKSRVIDLHEVIDGDDPFYRLYEKRWDNMDDPKEEQKRWKRVLWDQGWLSSGFAKTHLPGIFGSDWWSEFLGADEEATIFSVGTSKLLR